MAYPFDIFTALCKVNHALVGDAVTAGDVEALQPLAVLGNSINGLLSDVLVVGNIQSQQRRAILNQSDQARVGQAPAVCQRQPLDPGAGGQGQDASIVDLVSKGGEV